MGLAATSLLLKALPEEACSAIDVTLNTQHSRDSCHKELASDGDRYQTVVTFPGLIGVRVPTRRRLQHLRIERLDLRFERAIDVPRITTYVGRVMADVLLEATQ